MPPEWVSESRLEELVRSCGRVSPEIDTEFYKEFLNTNVVTLARHSDPSESIEGYQLVDRGTKFHVQLLEYKNQPVVAIFSSMKRMTDVIPEEYYRGTGFIQLKCENLLKMMMESDPKSRFALNPGHMVVKEFSPEEVNALLSGTIFKELEAARIARSTPKPVPLPKDAQILVGRPKSVPTLLLNKLADYFQSSQSVEQAWLGQIFIPSTGQPEHLFVCLKLYPGAEITFDQVSIDIGPTIRSVLADKELLDILDAAGQPKDFLDRLIPFFPKVT